MPQKYFSTNFSLKIYDHTKFILDREKLWQVREEYGVRGSLLRAVRSLYRGSEASVQVMGRLSEWFKIARGVRQGCVMSPWLFNIFMDKIVREVQASSVGGVQMTSTKVQMILFADDVLLVTEEEKAMKKNLEALDKAMGK